MIGKKMCFVKRMIALVLCMISILFTGCNSLFLGDTTVVLLRQEEFFPATAYKYANKIKYGLEFGEGVDAFYINPYHSKEPDDLLFFECLDMIGESTFVYGYQTIIREPVKETEEEKEREISFETVMENGKGVLKAYEIIRDETGTIIERKDVSAEYAYEGTVAISTPTPTPGEWVKPALSGTPTPTVAPDPMVLPTPVLSPTEGTSPTPTPTPSPSPTPTPLPEVVVTVEGGTVISKTEEVRLEKQNIGKMVTQFMAYNFKTRKAHIIYKHITDGSEAPSMFIQELPQTSSGWDRDYFLYFNRSCYYYRLKTGSPMKSELYNAADGSFGIDGAYALISATGDQTKSMMINNVCSTGQNDRIHFNTIVETSGIDENTDIPDDIDENSEEMKEFYGSYGIRIQLEFPVYGESWFERVDGSHYKFLGSDSLAMKSPDGTIISTLPRNGAILGNIKWENEYVTEWMSGVIDYVEDWYVEAPPQQPTYPSALVRDDVTTTTIDGITLPFTFPQELVDQVTEYLVVVAEYLEEKANYDNRVATNTRKTTTRRRSTIDDSSQGYEKVDGYNHTKIRVYLKDGGRCFQVRYLFTVATTMPYYDTGRIVFNGNTAVVMDQDAELRAYYDAGGQGEIPTDNSTVHTYLVADSDLTSVAQMPKGATKGIMGFSSDYIYLIKEGTLENQSFYNTEAPSDKQISGNTAIRISYKEIWDPIERTVAVQRESASTVQPDDVGATSNDTTVTQRTDANGNPIDTSKVNTGKDNGELLDGLPVVEKDNTETDRSGVGGKDQFGNGGDLQTDTSGVNLDELDPAEVYSTKNFIIRENDTIITSRYCGIMIYETYGQRKLQRVSEGSFYRSFASSKAETYVALGFPDSETDYQEYDMINAKAYEYKVKVNN